MPAWNLPLAFLAFVAAVVLMSGTASASYLISVAPTGVDSVVSVPIALNVTTSGTENTTVCQYQAAAANHTMTNYTAINTTPTGWYSATVLSGAANGTYPVVVYCQLTNGTWYANSSLTVVYTAPVAPQSGLVTTLVDSGSGLGGFLTAVTNPIVNIVLALGFIGGILAIMFGLASAIKGVFSGSMKSVSG
jgi:hypothetical protein